MLKGLIDWVVDNQGEFNVDGLQLIVDGVKGEDVINFLYKYVYEMYQKFYLNVVDGELQMGIELNYEVVVEEEKFYGGYEENYVDYEYLFKYDYYYDCGYEEYYYYYDYGYRDEYVNVGFFKVSDVYCYYYDYSGYSYGYQYGESVKKREFRLFEEIVEEEDLLYYGFEGYVYLSDEQFSCFLVFELGLIFFFICNFNVYICVVYFLFIYCRMMYSFRGDIMCVGSL